MSSHLAPQLLQRMMAMQELRDVSTDQQDQGLSATLVIDRIPRRARHLSAALTTYSTSIRQREVSPCTGAQSVLRGHGVDPRYQLGPDSLNGIYIKAPNRRQRARLQTQRDSVHRTAQLSRVTSPTAALLGASTTTPRRPPRPGHDSALHHCSLRVAAYFVAGQPQGQYPAVTLTQPRPNVALGDAVAALNARRTRLPSTVHATSRNCAGLPGFAPQRPILFLLRSSRYSFSHSLRGLSTAHHSLHFAAAGVGAILALLLTERPQHIALIGISFSSACEKNAIMMIDLPCSRADQAAAVEAIYQACLLRFRHHDDHCGTLRGLHWPSHGVVRTAQAAGITIVGRSSFRRSHIVQTPRLSFFDRLNGAS